MPVKFINLADATGKVYRTIAFFFQCALHLHLHLILAEASRAKIIAARDKMSVQEAIQIFPQINKDSLLSGFILPLCFFPPYVDFLYPII